MTTDFYEEQKEQGYYGIVRWQVEDIHQYREDHEMVEWTDDEAETWLASMEGNIQDRMIEEGWEVISMLMDED
jgi:hypothetical protein|tara:strand:+ start:5770 stop:5988 length:219 start_codon:yes stop_codon:yes gene_type:complete